MNKLINWFIIGTFVLLYFIVSIISTIHVIDFFRLSNPEWLSISLAIAFEIGAAASLASIIILSKTNKALVWTLFIILTLVQAMGNTYYAFSHLENYQGWIELFGLIDEEPIAQKRILSIISGAILPLVALGFIKSLVDYIKPDKVEVKNEETIIEEIKGDSNSESVLASQKEEDPNNDAVGEMEKEVDRLLSYKDVSERESIKEKIKEKMLELVKKEKELAIHDKQEVLDISQNIDENNHIEDSEEDELNIETDKKKPLNKRRPFKKNEIVSHYKGGVT